MVFDLFGIGEMEEERLNEVTLRLTREIAQKNCVSPVFSFICFAYFTLIANFSIKIIKLKK